MREISVEDINNLVAGAAFLGSGGGGNPYLVKLLAIETMRQYNNVKLIDIEELSENDIIIPLLDMGAPTICNEKLFTIESHINAFKTLEKYLGKKAQAVMSVEIGGINSIVPLIVASALNLSLIDGDAMGRAFPEMQMTKYTFYSIHASPVAIADDRGNSLVINAVDNFWAEKLARSATTDMGLTVSVACFSGTKKDIVPAIIKGSMTYAETIGKIINSKPSLEMLIEATNSYLLFEGKVSEVNNSIEKGFNKGECVIINQKEKLNIKFQNEFLLASLRDKILVTTPDLIVVLEDETYIPLTTDTIKYGMRVKVLGVPCNECWRSPEGIRLVGPRYFGYKIDYLPLEERVKGKGD